MQVLALYYIHKLTVSLTTGCTGMHFWYRNDSGVMVVRHPHYQLQETFYITTWLDGSICCLAQTKELKYRDGLKRVQHISRLDKTMLSKLGMSLIILNPFYFSLIPFQFFSLRCVHHQIKNFHFKKK